MSSCQECDKWRRRLRAAEERFAEVCKERDEFWDQRDRLVEQQKHLASASQPAPAEPAGEADASAPGAAEKTCWTCAEYEPECDAGGLCRLHGPGTTPTSRCDDWCPQPSPPPAAPDGECLPWVDRPSSGDCPARKQGDGEEWCAWQSNPPTFYMVCTPLERENCYNSGLRRLGARHLAAIRALASDHDRLREELASVGRALGCPNGEERRTAEALTRVADGLREELAAAKERADACVQRVAIERKVREVLGLSQAQGTVEAVTDLKQRAEQAEADNLTLHAALADAELLKQQYATKVEQAEARAKAAEEKAKECGVRWVQVQSETKSRIEALRRVGGCPCDDKADALEEVVALMDEHGPEGGEGWWVPREQVEKALDSMAPARAEGPAGLWRSAAVSFASKLGIPIDLLAPKTEDGSDE